MGNSQSTEFSEKKKKDEAEKSKPSRKTIDRGWIIKELEKLTEDDSIKRLDKGLRAFCKDTISECDMELDRGKSVEWRHQIACLLVPEFKSIFDGVVKQIECEQSEQAKMKKSLEEECEEHLRTLAKESRTPREGSCQSLEERISSFLKDFSPRSGVSVFPSPAIQSADREADRLQSLRETHQKLTRIRDMSMILGELLVAVLALDFPQMETWLVAHQQFCVDHKSNSTELSLLKNIIASDANRYADFLMQRIHIICCIKSSCKEFLEHQNVNRLNQSLNFYASNYEAYSLNLSNLQGLLFVLELKTVHQEKIEKQKRLLQKKKEDEAKRLAEEKRKKEEEEKRKKEEENRRRYRSVPSNREQNPSQSSYQPPPRRIELTKEQLKAFHLQNLGFQQTDEPSAAEVKVAFRNLALKWHPDKIQESAKKERATEMFQKVKQAYDYLLQ